MKASPGSAVGRRFGIGLALVAFAAGCSPSLPDPDSDGAQLLVQRCNGCHRVYPPGLMTAAMWDVMVRRMQGELVRRGLPPLTGKEERILLEYLHTHASNASKQEGP